MLSCKVFLLLVSLHIATSIHLTSVLSPPDGQRILNHFKAPFKDLETAYNAINGLKHYSQGGAIGTPETQSACQFAKACDTKSLASIFYATSILNDLGSSCKHQFSKETVSFVSSSIADKSDTKTLFYAVSSLKNLKAKVDNTAVTNALLNAIKEDNSVISSSYALLTASQLTNSNLAALLKSADIEDMAAQADEVDGRYLHFENDMQVTSTFLTAVFAISETSKQAPLISAEQIVLFVNYLMKSKASISSAKDAACLMMALGKITASTQISLAKAEVASGTSISEDTPKISVSVLNVFGHPLTKLTVKADSITRSTDNNMLLSNAPFKFDGLRSYDLQLWKNNPKSGFYDVSLSVASAGKKLIGVTDFHFKVKVTTKIGLVNVELGSVEKESSALTLKKIDFMKKANQLKADNQQKVVLKFQVQDLKDKSLISPHQAFVRFVNEKTGQEVIFVAEPDKQLTFKFEVDLSTGGREQFNSVSGKYSMHLIIGDVSISNPLFWNFADIALQLGDESQKAKTSYEDQYRVKPEIHHLFRQPEKRPPQVVSQAFTLACLFPILILFVLWARIGANLGNMNVSLKSIVFHLGLTGIFVLYYMFWTKWNMFTTLQYLTVVGGVTFVFGNSVLSELANNR